MLHTMRYIAALHTRQRCQAPAPPASETRCNHGDSTPRSPVYDLPLRSTDTALLFHLSDRPTDRRTTTETGRHSIPEHYTGVFISVAVEQQPPAASSITVPQFLLPYLTWSYVADAAAAVVKIVEMVQKRTLTGNLRRQIVSSSSLNINDDDNDDIEMRRDGKEKRPLHPLSLPTTALQPTRAV